MIEEDYVSFETAKLLKEKGFEGRMHTFYTEEGTEMESAYVVPSNFFPIYRPTLQMAMKWLREKRISITLNIIGFNLNDLPVWNFDIWRSNNHEYRSSDYFDSYEQACEAGIKYCLENLI